MADLQSFLSLLERENQLARVRVEVDPELEITEIATRVVKQQGPALLFENVKGSPFPLAINILGGEKRIELALGRHPQEVGAKLKRLIEAAMPPRPKRLLEEWRSVARVLAMPPKRVRHAACQELEEPPDLQQLPIMKCWPKDAGRFVTFGMVLTHDPETDARNLGIYRMQVVGPDRVLMHWQIQKGGGFHYWKAEQQGKALAVAVAIGGDPIYYLTAVSPLPEGIDELAFAGFLRGKPVPLVYRKTKATAVPADVEIVLEGFVPPDERLSEGPFGDHFGHYSHPKPCPVMWEQFAKEDMKAALGLLGTGQMALTKCVVLVDAEVDARNFNAVLRAMRDHFDPSKDFLLLPGVPFDTLDFTSLTLNVGSKMVLDATRKERVSSPADAQVSYEQL